MGKLGTIIAIIKKIFGLSRYKHIESLKYTRHVDNVTVKYVPVASMPQPEVRRSVPLLDSLFSHVNPNTKYFTWDRNIGNYGYAIFTDTSVNQSLHYPKHRKIAWMLESPEVTQASYNWLYPNINKFDYVLTFRKDLLMSYPDKCRFAPASSCWIRPENMLVHKKTKLLSIIASNKNFATGHHLRIEVINKLKSKMDVYGRGWNPIADKTDGLKDYMFSIAIENNKSDYYFTEKLLDCFATGTVPIYYGCPSIGDIFNPDGIIMVNNYSDIENVIDEITPELYNKMLPAINDNFNILKNFINCDDYIYANHRDILMGTNFKKDEIMSDKITLNSAVDEVYVINLDRRMDRWAAITGELTKHNISCTRWSAFDGRNISGPHHMRHGDMPGEKIKGAVGALRSHRSVIADAQAKGHKSICVLEDDLILQPDFNNKFDALMKNAPVNWDMLYLGCHWHGLPEPQHVGNNIYKLRCFGVFGVLIKNSAFQIILDSTAREDVPMDDYFVKSIHPRLNVYTTIPFLVKVKPDFSDIAGKFAEYDIISKYFY